MSSAPSGTIRDTATNLSSTVFDIPFVIQNTSLTDRLEMTQPSDLQNGVGTSTKAKPNGHRAPDPKEASESATTLCEILGGDGFAPLSEVLELMDLAAGRTAHRHVGDQVVTASFEELTVCAPVPCGALVRVSARVVATGRSSVLLRVEAAAERVTERRFVDCVRAYATFVAVGAVRHVPPLLTTDEAGSNARKRLSAARRAFAAVSPVPLELRASGPSDGERVLTGDATLRFQKQYLPRHRNFAGMVFGGDLLATTARLAAYAARRLARDSADARVVAIKYFSFVHPIEPMNLWRLVARIAAVDSAHVFVEVSASISCAANGATVVHSHDALYAVLLVDPAGAPVACPATIDFSDADEDERRAHHRALHWIDEGSLDPNVLRSPV